ncbi:CC0125/CC1285 family lipoprotein [Nisaea nitritireducens]|uniref:CC0125/CC1285 family lipoprotein n=1 Tax=Nisaea nitritireducens TaxID=568392 RepID=UPI001865A6FB|nr:hypothetical protein [Nisaea nitritireducens]
MNIEQSSFCAPRLRIPALLFLVLLLPVLAGCASPTPYAPLTDRFGYKDSSIESNRYRVSFSGNSSTDRETVETYLLYRAAELTLEKGAAYFLVVERDVEKTDRYLNYSYAPFGYAGYGYYGYHGGYYFRHRIYSGPDESVPISRYEAIAEIVVGGPGLSSNKADLYMAKEVIENLGPKIVRPKR